MTAATSASENDGAFQEVFWLGITKKAGSAYQFAAISEDLTPEEGDKDGEGVAMGNGGRIWKRTPEGDAEITIKIYPLDLRATSSADMAMFFTGDDTDSTAPISTTNTRVRNLFQVAALWTDDLTATTAEGTTVSGYAARRIVFLDARCTSYKESFDDKILSAEVKFKVPAFNRSGTGRIVRDSVTSQDGAGLSALAAYS